MSSERPLAQGAAGITFEALNSKKNALNIRFLLGEAVTYQQNAKRFRDKADVLERQAQSYQIQAGALISCQWLEMKDTRDLADQLEQRMINLEIEESNGIKRDRSGLVQGYDTIVGRAWADIASEESEAVERGHAALQALGVDTVSE